MYIAGLILVSPIFSFDLLVTMEDDYSIPIGSRYHPERTLLWEVNSPIESTEEWMGPR